MIAKFKVPVVTAEGDEDNYTYEGKILAINGEHITIKISKYYQGYEEDPIGIMTFNKEYLINKIVITNKK